MNLYLSIGIIVVLSYLIGSFPSGVVISKMFFGFDIRTQGSGNMGSTNVFRILGKKWGFVVQALDMVKGLLAVNLVAGLIGTQILEVDFYKNEEYLIKIIAGISSVLGHIFSIFVSFKGGKGINTAAGMVVGLAPFDFGVCFVCFWIAVGFTGYISLGSIVGALALPLSMIIRHNVFLVEIAGYNTLIYFLVSLGLLIVYTHRSNVIRILKGTESKFEKLQVINFSKNKVKQG